MFSVLYNNLKASENVFQDIQHREESRKKTCSDVFGGEIQGDECFDKTRSWWFGVAS